MSTINLHTFPDARGVRPSFRPSVQKAAFMLTRADRAGIEQLLLLGEMRRVDYPNLLTGFLRHKLRISCDAPEPAPEELVTAERKVVYMISGNGAEAGVPTFGSATGPERIPVSSLLGATLIGMRKLQKAPLLCDDGGIATVVVLDTSPLRMGAAA